jgi:hypothetical protein
MNATPSAGSVTKCHLFNRKKVAVVTKAARLYSSTNAYAFAIPKA